MAGIYVHIPFCKRKCIYCGFFSLPAQKRRQDFLEALRAEIFLNRDYLNGEPVETLYFGGGTPSLLSPEEIRGIIDDLARTFPISKEAEITLEINPDDVTPDYIKGLLQTPVRRFSLGIQSFFPDDLQWLTRIHDGQQAIGAVRALQDAGLQNITIDLIYGIPTLTLGKWQQNLDTAFGLGIPHLSAYALTVEPKTILEVQIGKGKLPPPDEEAIAAHYHILTERASAEGFQHYEISNFCKPGFHSRHNSNYWKGVSYLGLGPSAHSYNGNSRRWIPGNLEAYIRNFKGYQGPGSALHGLSDSPPYLREILSPKDLYNEYVMTGLRTMWGCDLIKIEKEYGPEYRDHFLRQSARYIASGRMIRKGDGFCLTEEGMLYADGIAAECFIESSDPDS